MPRVIIDPALTRTVVNDFTFPLGVYPVEPLEPAPGFIHEFEAADGAEPFIDSNNGSDEWEEWPDRFMFDALLTAPRVPAIIRNLILLLPTRIYPILDVLGNDDYREVDPYIAYDLVGLDRFINSIRDFGPWLYEDGLVGFGAMSIEPFVYFFLDEHQILTIRVQLDLKDTVEKILAAFDLKPVPEIRGPDAVSHEHRVILAPPPDDSPDVLTVPEILDRLRTDWALQLNIAGDTNLDDEGNELGITGWRCVVRCLADEKGPEVYAEIFLTADGLDRAEQLAIDAIADQPPSKEGWLEIEPVSCDRLTPNHLAEALAVKDEPPRDENKIILVRWPTQA